MKCKKRIHEGESIRSVWQDYKDKYSYGGFRDMLYANSLDERLNFNDELTPL